MAVPQAQKEIHTKMIQQKSFEQDGERLLRIENGVETYKDNIRYKEEKNFRK